MLFVSLFYYNFYQHFHQDYCNLFIIITNMLYATLLLVIIVFINVVVITAASFDSVSYYLLCYHYNLYFEVDIITVMIVDALLFISSLTIISPIIVFINII